MKKFDYKTTTWTDGIISYVEYLRKEGADGWQVCFESHYGTAKAFAHTWMREIHEEAKPDMVLPNKKEIFDHILQCKDFPYSFKEKEIDAISEEVLILIKEKNKQKKLTSQPSAKEMENIATDIAVMRGSQERGEAIIKLIHEVQEENDNEIHFFNIWARSNHWVIVERGTWIHPMAEESTTAELLTIYRNEKGK